ncbi:putative DNA-3-methyladenine glycosylase [Hypsibius exemplaris]|uniref:DNA-3-methyladenine glycosylase n=1 Tax=Hypsibius exemplaris TaxID=2072580 RepID=A0A1W0WEV4_HYPEX|nr:putative DNA-3-methyladenine glycosylase [Hypsibius exemplaris]
MKSARTVRTTTQKCVRDSAVRLKVEEAVREEVSAVYQSSPVEIARSPSVVLGSDFYNQTVHSLAKALLGKVVVREVKDGVRLKGRIVETEAYPGSTDPASHTYRGKTERNAAMFERAGTAYVYIIYGMYHCLNISSPEEGAGVLIRALQPLTGIETMRIFRKGGATLKQTDLCNGPGRLCQAFSITKTTFDKHDLHAGEALWLEDDSAGPSEFTIVESPRIGINPKSHDAESVRRPWRYYIMGCPDVSKKDKVAELVHGSTVSTVRAASGGSSSRGRRKTLDWALQQ